MDLGGEGLGPLGDANAGGFQFRPVGARLTWPPLGRWETHSLALAQENTHLIASPVSPAYGPMEGITPCNEA